MTVIELRGAPGEFTVSDGECVALAGPPGLLPLLALFEAAAPGRLLLEGTDTGRLTEPERALLRGRRIGLLLRRPVLLPHRTAEENLLLAQVYARTPRAGRRAAARAALEAVGLGHRAAALPGALSDGERQCLALARALVNRPALLLCEEPTAGLDPAAAGTVLDHLDRLHGEGRTVLLLTRDRAAADRAGRTVRLPDGETAGAVVV
ncbi:ATP-binding cassette domain-containing protein [Kitasatospora sp. NPDC051853]|uniref:ATP-binding cassette domain-containing protein n=1 Tax=Kitasatospora sp. NPDC051853 TaxID=3364058 RepID=UPI00378748AC